MIANLGSSRAEPLSIKRLMDVDYDESNVILLSHPGGLPSPNLDKQLVCYIRCRGAPRTENNLRKFRMPEWLTFCIFGRNHTIGVDQKPVAWAGGEIAQMIGASRETVTRLFADFKKKQLLEIKGSTIIEQDARNSLLTIQAAQRQREMMLSHKAIMRARLFRALTKPTAMSIWSRKRTFRSA